jgi:hypothetical protein
VCVCGGLGSFRFSFLNHFGVCMGSLLVFYVGGLGDDLGLGICMRGFG